MKRKTTKSSGNVFVDLGFDRAEAVVLQMRATLGGSPQPPQVDQFLTAAEAVASHTRG
jgi:hypothetical protein